MRFKVNFGMNPAGLVVESHASVARLIFATKLYGIQQLPRGVC
jgi:hypothetical protein